MESGHFLDLISIYSFDDNYLLCAMHSKFSIFFFSYYDLFN